MHIVEEFGFRLMESRFHVLIAVSNGKYDWTSGGILAHSGLLADNAAQPRAQWKTEMTALGRFKGLLARHVRIF